MQHAFAARRRGRPPQLLPEASLALSQLGHQLLVYAIRLAACASGNQCANETSFVIPIEPSGLLRSLEDEQFEGRVSELAVAAR